MATADTARDASPFHAGELAIQERVGVRERMDRFARKVVRDHMPDQHRELYEKLPFMVLGYVDDDGWPWASLWSGAPGFVRTPDARSMRLGGRPPEGDPLVAALRVGRAIGLLGLEPATRRRNRLTTHVAAVDDGGVLLAVDQAFGNCPQYIQTRVLRHARDPDAPFAAPAPEPFTKLDDRARQLIREADTFFVASAASSGDGDRILGADASHRGGKKGFVRVDEDGTLVVPDFVGNYHFNTLGNFLVYPRAGVTFVDFETGELLLLTGTVEIVWEGPEVEAFAGAERLWRFRLDHGVRLAEGTALRFSFGQWSPNTEMTSTWTTALAALEAERLREQWRPYRVVRVVDESETVRSFHLEAGDGLGVARHEAGQHIVVRVTPPGAKAPAIRAYTLSSAPADPHYRISVQREGDVSSFLHDQVRVGDVLEALAPRGNFVFDATERRPAVLLSGGVGVTPMIAMLRHAVSEGKRTRHTRKATFVHSARDAASRPFLDETRRLEALADGAVRVVSCLTQAEPGDDRDLDGRLDADALRALLPLDDYDFYLCGPAPFMQAMYDALRSLGVRDARLHAEAFGPSALKRRADESAADTARVPEATEAIVELASSGAELSWTPDDGTLLELVEAHGVVAPFGCRSGACGSCAVRVEGDVVHRNATASVPAGCALLCRAVPAARDEPGPVRLRVLL